MKKKKDRMLKIKSLGKKLYAAGKIKSKKKKEENSEVWDKGKREDFYYNIDSISIFIDSFVCNYTALLGSMIDITSTVSPK